MTNELTLRDIAKAILAKHGGVSGRELNRLAEKHGHRINYTTINAMASGSYASRPSKVTLDALVALSDFTAEQVYAAAHRPVPLRPLAEMLPDGADALLPGQRQAVLAVVRQFVKDNERQEKTNVPPNTRDGVSPSGGDATKHRVVRTRTRRPTSGGPDEQYPDDTPSDPQ